MYQNSKDQNSFLIKLSCIWFANRKDVIVSFGIGSWYRYIDGCSNDKKIVFKYILNKE